MAWWRSCLNYLPPASRHCRGVLGSCGISWSAALGACFGEAGWHGLPTRQKRQQRIGGKKSPPGNETNISHLGEVRNIIDSKVPNGRGYVNFCGGYFCEVRVFPWRKTLQKWNLHQDQSTGDVPFLSVESSVLEGLNGAFRMLPESRCNEMLEPWMLWHRFVAICRPT